MNVQLKSTKGKARSILFGSLLVQFILVLLDGRKALVGEARDDHKDIDVLRRQIARWPLELRELPADARIERLSGAAARAVRPLRPEKGAPPIPGATLIEEIRRMADRQGWKPEDLAGTGENGTAGEEGGRNALTSLTLANMAYCAPPPEWEKHRGKKWPWECVGWRPPTPAWRPPSSGDPSRKILDPNDRTPPGPGAVEDLEAYARAKTEGRITELHGPGSETPVADPQKGEKPADAGKPDAPKDPTAGDDAKDLEGYPAAHVERARELLKALEHERSGKAPSVGAANFVLNEAELPKVNKVQLTALLATP